MAERRSCRSQLFWTRPLAPWSPGAPHQGLEHEARLANENDALARAAGFSLYGASPFRASAGSPLRRVRGPGARASGSSSPSPSARARHGRDDSERRNASRSAGPRGARSKGPCGSRVPVVLSGAIRRAVLALVGTASAWLRGGVWLAVPRFRLLCRHPSIGRASLAKPRPGRRPLRPSSLASATRRRERDGPPVLPLSLWVSCT